MSYVKVLLVAVLYVACGEARFALFSKCQNTTFNVENVSPHLPNTWYVYGREPSKWFEHCFNYTISAQNSDLSFNVTESDRRTLWGKSSTDYELNVKTSELKLKKKSFLSIGSDKWTVAAADSELAEYIVLYQCGWFTESAQIWVTESYLNKLQSKDGITDELGKALESIKYKESDFQIRKAGDC